MLIEEQVEVDQVGKNELRVLFFKKLKIVLSCGDGHGNGPGALGGNDVCIRISHNEAMFDRDLQPSGTFKDGIRRRFASFHLS